MPTAKKTTKTAKKSTAIAKKPASPTTPQLRGASKTALAKQVPASKALAKKSTKTTALAQPAAIVSKYQSHKNDTGSTTVQIAGISQQIVDLQKHLKTHAKDHDYRRGLLIMVGKRRKLLNYLKRSDAKTYQQLIGDLKLRK